MQLPHYQKKWYYTYILPRATKSRTSPLYPTEKRRDEEFESFINSPTGRKCTDIVKGEGDFPVVTRGDV